MVEKKMKEAKLRRYIPIISLSVLSIIFLGIAGYIYTDRNKIIRDFNNRKILENIDRNMMDSLKWVADSLSFETERMKILLEALEETGSYLVIDTKSKRFQLRKGKMILREGPCAVGKGYTTSGNRSWNFQTPTGERKIVSKTENPTWYRPAWHWQEKGKPVPKNFITFSPKMPEAERKEAYRIMSHDEKELVRAVPGELGKFSLGLGDGYFIHYGRGLGQAVSHGCVRVGADDLEVIYSILQIGDPVFIY